MVCLKSAAYWRPVWYTLSRTRTVTRRPVVVFVRAMQCRAMSTVWKRTPWQARVMCGNARCAIGLCLEPYGGSWATRLSRPSRLASPCRASLNRSGVALLRPPPAPRISSRVAWGCPARPELGRLYGRIPTSLLLRQPPEQSLHLPFDICCIHVHAALLDPGSPPSQGYYGSHNPGRYA